MMSNLVGIDAAEMVLGMKEQERDTILTQGIEILWSFELRSVVARNDKKRVRVPGLLTGGSEKPFESKIGVLNRFMYCERPFLETSTVLLRHRIGMMGG